MNITADKTETTARISETEPSRLKIAAMILQGWASNPNLTPVLPNDMRPPEGALRIADALILAAKNTSTN